MLVDRSASSSLMYFETFPFEMNGEKVKIIVGCRLKFAQSKKGNAVAQSGRKNKVNKSRAVISIG